MSLDKETTLQEAPRSIIIGAKVVGINSIYSSVDINIDVELYGCTIQKYTIPIRKEYYKDINLKIGDSIDIQVNRTNDSM